MNTATTLLIMNPGRTNVMIRNLATFSSLLCLSIICSHDSTEVRTLQKYLHSYCDASRLLRDHYESDAHDPSSETGRSLPTSPHHDEIKAYSGGSRTLVPIHGAGGLMTIGQRVR